jgi:hypothetical protein
MRTSTCSRTLNAATNLIEIVDGRMSDASIDSIDTSDEFVRGSFELLILRDIRARGYGDLYEHTLVAHVGILLQQHLERIQLVLDALDVVQTIDAYTNTHTHIAEGKE